MNLLKSFSVRSFFLPSIIFVTGTHAYSVKSVISTLATCRIGTEKAGQLFQDLGREA